MKPTKRKTVRIDIPRTWAEQFKHEAKRLFPAECYAIILGVVEGGAKKVQWLYFPDIDGINSDENSVHVQESWWRHAEDIARAKGMVVLGDIHSHCYDVGEEIKDAAPSQTDWDGNDRDYAIGICVVSKMKSGSKRASLRFWEMPPTVVVRETEE